MWTICRSVFGSHFKGSCWNVTPVRATESRTGVYGCQLIKYFHFSYGFKMLSIGHALSHSITASSMAFLSAFRATPIPFVASGPSIASAVRTDSDASLRASLGKTLRFST